MQAVTRFLAALVWLTSTKRGIVKRSIVICLIIVTLVASACGSKEQVAEKSPVDGGGAVTSTTRRSTDAQVFGTLESPCGKAPEGKTVTIKAEEAGRGTDRLYIGVGNDRTADAQPGMNKELWDTTLAFVAWCNEQGGVAGIPLDPIDIDGRYFHVEEAMTTACSETFALVGGGLVFDNQVFSGKDGSDFHKCRLIAVPGFAVSTDFAEASGVIQPLPNPAHRKSAVWLQDVASLFPEEVAKTVAVYGEGVTSIAINRDPGVADLERVIVVGAGRAGDEAAAPIVGFPVFDAHDSGSDVTAGIMGCADGRCDRARITMGRADIGPNHQESPSCLTGTDVRSY